MHLDDRLDTPLYQQLFDQLRHRIYEGGQPEGSRLPPIRSMAADLGCARNTVENAYALLAQEGYVKSRPGSGYIVQNVAFVQADADRGALLAEPLIGAKASRARYDFTYGDLEPGSFPAAAWRAITDENNRIDNTDIIHRPLDGHHRVREEDEFLFEYKPSPEEEEQEAEEAELRRERSLSQAVLDIKKKYGKNAILKGINLMEGATAIDRNQQIGGHRA